MSCLYTMLDQKDNKEHITISQTLHTMVEKIDAGNMLVEKKYVISRNSSLFYAYSTLYVDTIHLFNHAVKNYLLGQFKKQDMNLRQYFSFPNKEISSNFRSNFKIFSLEDLLTNMGLIDIENTFRGGMILYYTKIFVY